MKHEINGKNPRHYAARIRYNEEQGKLLQQNYDNWQKIYKIALDRVLTLCGAYTPTNEKIDNIHSRKYKDIREQLEIYIAPNSKKTSPEYKQALESAYKTIVTFVNWFPAEAVHEDNVSHVVSWEEAIKRFQSYWDEENYGPYNQQVLDALPSLGINEKAHLIDRHQKFLDTNLNPQEAESIFRKLSYKGAFGADQSQIWRSIVSNNFGNGPKSDLEWDTAIVQYIIGYLENYAQETIRTDDLIDHLKQQNLWNPEKWKTQKKGNPPTWHKKLIGEERQETLQVKSYIKTCQNRIKNKNENKKNKKLSPQYGEFFINGILQLNLFPFEKNNAYWYMAYGKVWGILVSHKSNAIHRIVQQIHLFYNNQELYEKAPQQVAALHQFCQHMTKKLEIGGDNNERIYRIREHQETGVQEFVDFVRQGNNYEEAIEETSHYLDGKALKNSNRELLYFLYNNFDLQQPVEKILAAIKWHYQQEKIEKAKLGYVADISHHPQRPFYSEKVNLHKGKWRKNPAQHWKERDNQEFDPELPNIEIPLLTDQGIQREKFNIDSKRAEQEFLYETPDEPATGKKLSRNTKHLNPEFDSDKPPNVLLNEKDKKDTFEIFPQEPSWGPDLSWHIGMVFDTVFPSKKLKDIECPQVMGSDLGWREPAAYTILDGEEAIIESGFCRWEHDPSIFSPPNSDSDYLEKLQEWYKELNPNTNGKLPSNFPKIVKSAATCLRKKLNTQEITQETLEQIECWVGLVSPHFQSKWSRHYQPNQGALSFIRIEMMEELKRLLAKLHSIYEYNKKPVPEKFSFARNRIEQKMNNIRKERAKIIGRMIIKKAIDFDCNIIALENLSISNERRKVKQMNRRNSKWCSRRIIEFVKETAPEHGIQVVECNSRYSSHKDVDGETWICRKVKVNPQTIPEKTPPGKRYPHSINSLTKKLNSYIKQRSQMSEKDKIYQQEAQEFLQGREFKEIIAEAKEQGETELYVPCQGGDFVESHTLGFKHSDIIASHVIAKRGLEKWQRAVNK